MPAPPPLAERLLRWSLADDERDAVLGDLQEEFNVISRVSLAHAARWYRSQAVLSIGPNLLRRVRSQIDGSRRLETEQSRRSRLKARKWGLTLLVLAVPMFLFGAHAAVATTGVILSFLAIGLLSGSLFPRRPRDAYTRAVSQRRGNLVMWCYMVAVVPEHFVGHTQAIADLERLWLVVGAVVLLWPTKYWVFGSSFLPRAPQIRTPFVGSHRAGDGSLLLTVDAPDAPLAVGDLIVVRDGGRRLVGISRVFSNAESLLVYAAVGEGPESTDVSVDVLDSADRVVRSVPARLTRAELVNLGVPARKPKVPPGQIEAVVSLRDLPPGDYRIRVTASDEKLRTQRYGEFRIGEREFSVRDVRQ